MKVAAAMAAGCSIVLKPPELAPFGANLFTQLALECGMPTGMLNIVPGGPEAGDALVRHPGIDKINFTGGPGTARMIQAAAAENLTPLLLELGGKSANLIFEDAYLEEAAEAASVGISTPGRPVLRGPQSLARPIVGLRGDRRACRPQHGSDDSR